MSPRLVGLGQRLVSDMAIMEPFAWPVPAFITLLFDQTLLKQTLISTRHALTPPPMDCCAQVAASLGYWDSLHGFSGVLLSSVYAASVTGHGLLLTAAYGLLTGSKAVLSGLLAALLAPVGWLLWILTSNATLIILAISLFLAWQVYYPSRWTLRWLSRLPNFQGVLFDLPPSENLDAAGVKPYVALTLNDFPCKYNTEPLLDLLAKHDAKATFFIAGAQVEKLDALGAGNGHHELGKATLRRMVAEGHELGNQTW